MPESFPPAAPPGVPAAPPTVRELRRRWKPTKERLKGRAEYEPTLIRVHRACSWLQRVEQLDGECTDETLVFQWIALNALYGRWDPARGDPVPDRVSLGQFLARVREMDVDGRLPAVLADCQGVVFALFEDVHLTNYFWEDPTDARARHATSARHKARTWYLEKRWPLILDKVVERVYLVRCQLVHGAATLRGKLNRAALALCCRVMAALLPAVLLVIIDHGAEADWGPLCYPPLKPGARMEA